MPTKKNEKLSSYHLLLPRAGVAKLRRKALDRSEQDRKTTYWSGLAREALTRLANEESN
jgi:histone H3/H4